MKALSFHCFSLLFLLILISVVNEVYSNSIFQLLAEVEKKETKPRRLGTSIFFSASFPPVSDSTIFPRVTSQKNGFTLLKASEPGGEGRVVFRRERGGGGGDASCEET